MVILIKLIATCYCPITLQFRNGFIKKDDDETRTSPRILFLSSYFKIKLFTN